MTELFPVVESAQLVDLVVRATILLVLSLVLQWLLRRWPAATRHHLWTLTFVLLLALPAVRHFGPSWDVSLVPNSNRPSEGIRRLEVSGPSVQPDPGAAAQLVGFLAADTDPGPGEPEAHPYRPWPRLAFLFWAAGCGVAFASLGVGILRFFRLVQGGRPVEDEAWLGQLDALRKQLCIRARVGLVLTGESVTPMTGGVLRPVILLPASATDWSESRRRAVLAHELVHVRRRDALRQLLGHSVFAVYWFHPLSWMASYFAAARREEACDDEVLAVGAKPSEYAGHLLSLAAGGAFSRPALLLPMAQRSQLERRIRAILGPRRARPRAPVAATVLAVAAVGGVSISVADPTRSTTARGAVAEAVASDAAGLDCVPVSDTNELAGWGFGQGLDDVLVCTPQGESVPSPGSGVPSTGSADWAVLEAEIRKQFERTNATSR